ncbi:hypothetical protein GCM10027074_66710 [Streptomyces deserti]
MNDIKPFRIEIPQPQLADRAPQRRVGDHGLEAGPGEPSGDRVAGGLTATRRHNGLSQAPSV